MISRGVGVGWGSDKKKHDSELQTRGVFYDN